MGHAIRLSPRLHRLIWKSAEVTSAHSPHYRESYFQQGSAASSSSVPFPLIHPWAQALSRALLCPCASAAVGPGWAGRCMPGWKSPWECPAPVLEEPEECGRQCWRLRVSREDDGTRLKPSPHSNQRHKIPPPSLLHPLPLLLRGTRQTPSRTPCARGPAPPSWVGAEVPMGGQRCRTLVQGFGDLVAAGGTGWEPQGQAASAKKVLFIVIVTQGPAACNHGGSRETSPLPPPPPSLLGGLWAGASRINPIPFTQERFPTPVVCAMWLGGTEDA